MSPSGAYELHLPADHVTIWYTVTSYQGQEVIGIQLVRPDTEAARSARYSADDFGWLST
jgi:hypothetical protein